jgi:hypothetical protein
VIEIENQNTPKKFMTPGIRDTHHHGEFQHPYPTPIKGKGEGEGEGQKENPLKKF